MYKLHSIEHAPKDGSKMLLYVEKDGKQIYDVGQYNTERGWWDWYCEGHRFTVEPTHFCPLPFLGVLQWNKDRDQDELCSCGHPYYRHFDSYEDNLPIGCKYCPCRVFKKVS